MFFLNFQPFAVRCLSPERDRTVVGGSADSASAVLDKVALDRLRDLDPSGANQLMSRVMSAFDASLLRLLPQLAQAQISQDCNAIRHVAHTLKSSSASIGALHLSRLCAELEAAARGGELDGMESRINTMRGECEVVALALKQTFAVRR